MAHDAWHRRDLQLRGRVGFALPTCGPRVMQHSRAETSVPFALAEMTAALLPDCRFVARERDEHFSPALLSAFIDREMLG